MCCASRTRSKWRNKKLPAARRKRRPHLRSVRRGKRAPRRSSHCDSDAFGNGRFGDFLIGWLRERGVVDLNKVRGSGAARTTARAANEAFIRDERVRLRSRLFGAALARKLPFTDALLDEFVVEGSDVVSAVDLDELDEA